MRIFDGFDRIRIINLPQRVDRRREMDRELARIGLATNSRVSYFAAIRPDDAGAFSSIGAHGVYLSHTALLREAAVAGESLLILEDDCAFADGAAEREGFGQWDIFYGGYAASTPENLSMSDIEGAHMMGFSAVGARRVSEYLEQLTCEGVHPPIDGAYVWFRRAHPDVRTMFAVPPLARQRSSRSDIADLKWYDRTLLFRDLASGLRSLRGRS